MLKNTIHHLKKIKSVKQSKLITHQPKTFENQNIVDKINYYRTSKSFT